MGCMGRTGRMGRIAPSCAVIILGLAVLWGATDGFRALTAESARRLQIADQRPVLPALRLDSMDGESLQLGTSSVPDDKVTLVEFIYTRCPTLCQSAAGPYASIRNSLQASGLGDRVRLLSVSFDPENDTPAHLRDYADRHGAHGKIWDIARIRTVDLPLLKRAFGLRVIPDQWGGYQHNAAIHVIDRSARLARIFDVDDVKGVLNFVEQQTR